MVRTCPDFGPFLYLPNTRAHAIDVVILEQSTDWRE